jgi:hypothetical protein
MNREEIARRLLPVTGVRVFNSVLDEIEAIVREAAQAERHRIYAALEADPGALWRDQGFQEWRKNRQDSDGR